jgi:hypothetical protein
MAALVPASETQTAILTINSLDRYASLDIARDPAQQTTPTDITFTIPGLEKVTSLQFNSITMTPSPGYVSSSPTMNANVINVIYNGVTTMMTLPFDCLSVTANTQLTSFVNKLKAVTDSTVQFAFMFASGGGGFQSYTTAPGTSGMNFYCWTSNLGTLGFSRVTTLNGVDITGYVQLFDILGLAYQNVAGVPTSQISAIGQWAQSTYSGNYNLSTNPFVLPGISIVSPNLDPVYPDMTTSTKTQYGTLICKPNNAFYTTNLGPANNIIPLTSSIKSFKPNGNKLRIRWLDAIGNIFPPKLPIPQVCKYVNSGANTYVGSAGSGVITMAGTAPALSLSGLVVGNYIETFNGSAIGVCGVWLITAITSTTITIACPYVGTVAVTLAGPYVIGGNTLGYGGTGEYVMSFLINYGPTNVPVTTSAILS